MRIRLFVPVAALAVGLGLGAPALASSRHALPVPRGGAATAGVRSSLFPERSTKFAGYQINTTGSQVVAKGGHIDVETTFVVPRLKCTKYPRAIGASVGMFEHSKANFSSANLFIGCVNRKPLYYPFITVDRQEFNFKKIVAHPGHEVMLEVSATKTKTTVLVLDKTRSVFRTKTGPGYGKFVGYPWIGDVTWSVKGRVRRPPDFGRIAFSNAEINLKPFGSHGGLQEFNRVGKKRLQIKTGEFARNHKSFTTLFRGG